MRFREHPYAVSGDIEAMYNQVLVPYEDRDVLRFLWFDGENIAHYHMKVHLFGGVWCSSAATYALRKTSNLQIMDKSTDYAINNSFYVDDYLASYESSEEAFNVSMSIKPSLKKFAFNLRKLVSPNKEVGLPINAIEENCTTKQLTGDDEMALGIRWDLERDFFYLVVPATPMGKSFSKQYMLSFLSSIFDPLGLLAPIIITGKILLQTAVRCYRSWDEHVSPDIQQQWNTWIESLAFLDRMKIPRCIKPKEF